MPLVRISFATPRDAQSRRAIADAAHLALQTALGVPLHDRFQILEFSSELIADPEFLGISRDEGAIFIEIHLLAGRSVDKKQALYRDLAEHLAKVGVEPRNIFVHLVETSRENLSFGNGVAQFVETPPTHV